MFSLRCLRYLLLLYSPAFANIVFNWVQPTCNLDHSSCLRGQHCHGTKCIADFKPIKQYQSEPEKRSIIAGRKVNLESDGLRGKSIRSLKDPYNRSGNPDEYSFRYDDKVQVPKRLKLEQALGRHTCSLFSHKGTCLWASR